MFAAFLELSTTPEVNITKRSTIELGYEIYQLRSAQCRNQGKILLLFSCACTGNFSYKVYHSMPLKKNKLPVPYLFVYIGLTFHQLYIELFWQNSSIKFNEMNLTKWKCGTFLEDFFFHLPLDIQYFWEKPSWYKQNIVSICKILFLMTRLLCGKRRECLWSVYTSGNFKWIFLLSELYRKRMLPWWTLNLCWFKVSLCISF